MTDPEGKSTRVASTFNTPLTLDPRPGRCLDRGMKPILLFLFVGLLMAGCCTKMPEEYKDKPPVEEQAKDLSP